MAGGGMYVLHDYLEMMRDGRRIDAFRAALRAAVRPGDAVMDVGAGTGVLSFLALEAGAGHVYAIEQLPVIEVARAVARGNGLADRITFIQGDARNVELPGTVDCVMGDVRGTLPLIGDNVDLFAMTRERWLAPGGRTVPVRDVVSAAPVAALAPHRAVADWSTQRDRVRYEAARKIAANNWYAARLEPGDLLAAAQELATVHYDRETPRRLGRNLSFIVERDGEMTGVGAWFRAVVAEGISFDTSPHSPPSVHSQAFFPLDEVRPVVAGEVIEVEIGIHRIPSDSIWTWTVASLGARPWREAHSTFQGALFGLNARELLVGNRIPALSADGMAAAGLLREIDGRTSVRDLAERISSQQPDRFPSADEALPYVMKIVARYCS